MIRKSFVNEGGIVIDILGGETRRGLLACMAFAVDGSDEVVSAD